MSVVEFPDSIFKRLGIFEFTVWNTFKTTKGLEFNVQFRLSYRGLFDVSVLFGFL